MPAPKALSQYHMPSAIRKLVAKKGYAVPTLANIERALTRVYNRDPDAFENESSRAVVVQDIAGGFIARNERAQRNQGEKRSPKGDITSYPLGYEYMILAASRLRPHIEGVRELYWESKEPLASFEDGVRWVNECHHSDLSQLESKPIKVKLEIKLMSDKEAIDTFGPRSVTFPGAVSSSELSNEAEVVRFGAWLQNADEKLRAAVLEKFSYAIETGPTLTLVPPSSYVTTQLGSTAIPRGYNEERALKWLTVDGGFLALALGYFMGLANQEAPGWTANDVFAYFLYDYLPAVPMSAETYYTSGKAYGVSYTFAYPVQEKKILESHRRNLELHNDSERLHYSMRPKELSEYELNLLELTYYMPEAEFSWSDRLERYCDLFNKEISAGLSPDLGLANEQDRTNKDKWNNASRNLGRDYKNALKKLGWSRSK